MEGRFILLFCLAALVNVPFAQQPACTFKAPFYLMHFGSGSVQDVNSSSLLWYSRVNSTCPTDGHYTYAAATRDCFRGDWHTLTEDHTPGDRGGNMLLVNSAYNEGVFLTSRVTGFKPGVTYQMGVWLMNVCKPSDKCPFPLLPNITVRLHGQNGKLVTQFSTGEVARRIIPVWSEYKAQFTMPASENSVTMTLINSAPGGCGNDFALDDISFRECFVPPLVKTVPKQNPPAIVAKTAPAPKKPKPEAAAPMPALSRRSEVVLTSTSSNAANRPLPQLNRPNALTNVPAVIKLRSNPVVRRLQVAEGDVKIELYDNGEIDGDTVSVYHNNSLVVSKQGLARKPISFSIPVSKLQPHHELVMVAENLGSIPPNTSLMIVTVKDKRFEVFISSTEKQNAKIVIELAD